MKKKIPIIATFVIIITVVLSFTIFKNNFEMRKVKNTKNNIVFAMPFAPVSYPVLKMLDDGVFDEDGIKTELVIWKTPDQLRALIAGKQGDFFAVPSNVASMFYNKGLGVKLLNISIWKAIWLISRKNDKKTLADFKGEEIAMPFKGDMPHIVFMELAKKQGLDPEKDFKLLYMPSPMDAAQRMIMRRVDNALLIDPAVSTVIEKSKSGLSSIVAPDIYRSVDIQKEWGRLYNSDNELPFAGIMAGSEILKNNKIVKKFIKEYKVATEWCMANPKKTAKLVLKYIPQLDEKGVEEAMKNVVLKAVDSKNARTRLENFFKVLHGSKPSLIGGKLPDNDFYFTN